MSITVDQEVAEQEFSRMVELMDIDTNLEDEDDRKGFEETKTKIVKAISKGRLVINENGEPIFTPKNGSAITFREPTGASLMAMDRRKKTEDIAKMYSVLGDVTKMPVKTFSSMPYSDLKICIAIITLFLG